MWVIPFVAVEVENEVAGGEEGEEVEGGGRVVESWTRTLRAGEPFEVSRTWQVMRSLVAILEVLVFWLRG